MVAHLGKLNWCQEMWFMYVKELFLAMIQWCRGIMGACHWSKVRPTRVRFPVESSYSFCEKDFFPTSQDYFDRGSRSPTSSGG